MRPCRSVGRYNLHLLWIISTRTVAGASDKRIVKMADLVLESVADQVPTKSDDVYTMPVAKFCHMLQLVATAKYNIYLQLTVPVYISHYSFLSTLYTYTLCINRFSIL